MSQIIASTYELIGEIGSGGGGIVYLANHIRLGKKVVMKADKRTLKTRPELLRREVDALKNLSHTYIPQVYDFFEVDETVYTVMDYIEGESLDKHLKRGEKFTQPQVIRWACQLLEALCYLHSPIHGNPPRGIVHSDIKPANIMLTPYGDIRLIDFNIALALGEENIVGRSEGYASPEYYGFDYSTDGSLEYDSKTEVMDNSDSTVLMGISCGYPSTSSKRIVIPDARSDIYSLGATLYHLLTGNRPASHATDVVKLSHNEFSLPVVDIITKAMNPNPDLRYQSAEEMLYAFEHLIENDGRMKRYKKDKVVTSLLLIAFMVTGIFSAFVGLKRMEMTKGALALAQYSQNAFELGDIGLAIELALRALPEQTDILVPEYKAEAKKALADALGIYDLSDGYKHYNILELPSETFKIALSPDGKTGAAIYAFAVAIFNTETGEILVTLPTVPSALADIEFVNEHTFIYAGDYTVVAGRDTPKIRILKRKTGDNKNIFMYNSEHIYDEARIKSDGTRLMLFDYRGFKLYDDVGNLISEVSIPEPEFIYDQQYSKKSGNLAVIYKDSLRIYSGSNGNLIFEKQNLRSIFYAHYGISILERDGRLSLIDIDTIEIDNYKVEAGEFGAYCGMIIDSAFLAGGELIGASKNDDGYLFAVSKYNVCSIYNDTGKKKFEIPSFEQSEAFFTDNAVIISPLHGTPAAYSTKTGKKISDLEKDSYLTYITQIDNYIVSEYISSEGRRFGILLDAFDYNPIAYLPGLTDILDNDLVFDYHRGVLRETRIYSIDELINIAKGGDVNN